MLAHKLRDIADKFKSEQSDSRPLELKKVLVQRMEELAAQGHYYLIFQFSDPQQIIDKTTFLLKKESFKITDVGGGSYRFEW